jgi:hypothetical protein
MQVVESMNNGPLKLEYREPEPLPMLDKQIAEMAVSLHDEK